MPIPAGRSSKRKPDRADRSGSIPGAVAASLPINIPDWSKIPKNDHRLGASPGGGRGFFEDEDGDDGNMVGIGVMIPPHELLCRSRAASFSVHEGIGRTLKGRDLSRVRDAVWQRIGFQD